MAFLGFEACSEHFQHFNWHRHGTFHVDIMEIMGGEGRATQVRVRRHFRAGKNFDAVIGVDLMLEEEVQDMMQHINQTKPLVIVMSPRCTAGGGWSTVNEVVCPQTHYESLRTSQHISRVCANAAMLQLQQGTHFISELPKGN